MNRLGIAFLVVAALAAPHVLAGGISGGGSGSATVANGVSTSGDLSITTSGVATVQGIQGNSVTAVTGSGTTVMLNVSPTVQTGMSIGNALTFSSTVPAIASGFGTSPSVTTGTDTAFVVNVGTGGTAYSGVLAMNATASNGWNCGVIAPAADRTLALSSTTTAVTLTNYALGSTSTGVWTASDLLNVNCVAR